MQTAQSTVSSDTEMSCSESSEEKLQGLRTVDPCGGLNGVSKAHVHAPTPGTCECVLLWGKGLADIIL